jgi:hypothetical protein
MFFLYHRKTRPTGQVLAESLGIPHGSQPPPDRQDLLIRWGNVSRVPYMPGVTLNPASAINRATDKLEALRRMRDRGIVVPDFSTNPRELTAPFLGRAETHTRGSDIVLCLQQSDAERNPRHHYVKYIPTAREYRVRVVGDTCVRVSQKFLHDSELAVPWMRNYVGGYLFNTPEVRLNEFQEAMAVAAVKCLGLHFGAVDLVVGDDGSTYILEVNTAPALAPKTAGAMVGGLVRLIEEKADITLDPDYSRLEILSDEADDGDTEPDEEVFDE